MTKKFFLFSCLALLTYTSCKKTGVALSDTDYLVFGHFYGECVGEKCVEIFRLEKDKLFEDTKDEYPNSKRFYKGKYVILSQQQYSDTKELLNFLPTELLNETNNIIGQPDAGDWGGLYVEYNYNGIRKFWLLDQMKRNVPSKYHNFIDSMNQKIMQLQ